MDTQGKVAVVTGSGSGIGKAIALALAREGADDIQRLIHRRADVIAEREGMINKLLQSMK